MNNYFETNNKKDCNGCGTCALRCPVKAIKMIEDKEGFLYPKIDKKKCINCGLCKKICSNNVKEKVYESKTYIAINKNAIEKKNSSSGGMYYVIAKYILNKKGIVFGVTFDKNLKAKHDYAETLNDAKKFQGSKYVRSDLNNSFQKVEEFLKKDKYVLFTGTPCQCYGLKKYLGKVYEKLITCEIVCHANPSPKVFEHYKKNIEHTKNKKIKNISFRSKENGWRNQTPIIEYEDGVKEEENTYFEAFVREMINRPSCYECKFSTTKKYSDFSIADLWGVEKIAPEIEDDDTGISLLNVNTTKGKEILQEIKDELFLQEIETKLAFSHNHHGNVPVHKNRDKFFEGISNGTINETNIIKYMKKYTKRPLYRRVLGKIKRTLIKMLNKLKHTN